jgi:4-amino-4-deoxy-L-arabinose transferase-like glycosyltransferase
VLAAISRPSSRDLNAPQAALIGAAIVVLWALWAAAFNTAQFGDNIEQFNWAQSLELGYHKHPPLPSLALGLVIRLFGPSVYWAYALATLCLLGTVWFTWLIGRELVGERLSAAAVLLWGLNLSFSHRVQLYNHNTVLVLCIAAAVWCAMQATRNGRSKLGWWAATGLVAGAGVLSKYQALVPLGGLVLASRARAQAPRSPG